VTTIATDYAAGSAIFVGGKDTNGAPVTSATTVTRTSALAGLPGNSFTISTAAPAFAPLPGAVAVRPGVTGYNFATASDPSDFRTYMIGGVSGGAFSMNVGVYSPTTGAYTAALTTTTTAGQATRFASAGRSNAAAAYVSRCSLADPANPKPCVVVVGGQGCLPGSADSCTAVNSPVSLNDVWVLWTTESPPRWELIADDTGATPESALNGRVSKRHSAVGAASSDGTVMFVYGGVTASGPTADIYTLAPAGYPDPVYPAEMTNIALNSPLTSESSQAVPWGNGGTKVAVDGDENPFFNNNNPAGTYTCTHTNDELSPWFSVRLNYTANIDAVRIVPRADCCQDRMQQYRLVSSP
jgi:hypothetical protein